MSRTRKQAKCKVLYEHLTADLKQVLEVCLLTVRKKRKYACIDDLHYISDFNSGFQYTIVFKKQINPLSS